MNIAQLQHALNGSEDLDIAVLSDQDNYLLSIVAHFWSYGLIRLQSPLLQVWPISEWLNMLKDWSSH